MIATSVDRTRYFAWKRFGFLLPLMLPALPAEAWWLAHRGWLSADAAPWLGVVMIFAVLPLLDLVVGSDTVNPADDESLALARDPYYRALLLLCVPAQLASLAFGAWAFVHWELSPLGQGGWILSVGSVTGSIAINVAHELIHKYSRVDQWAGGILLSSAAYPGFKIEHIRGHHVDIGTPKDNTTARFGQPLYAYLAVAFGTNYVKAWRFERKRLAALGLPAWHWRNELLWWYALTAVIAAACYALGGVAGVVFFVAQAIVGIGLLETVNYIEHYGLERKRLPDGRYEPVGVLHSWDSSSRLTNFYLFQLQRHADHHKYARRPYQILRHTREAPQLPAGYSAMILLALAPPLWFRVMNPRAEAARRRAG
jgi:alkane 1-monooxygenase